MNLELAILEKLEAAHPRLLKRSVVFGDVSFEVDRLTETDFSRALVQLERKGQVWIDQGEDVTRLKITPAGLARIAEAR